MSANQANPTSKAPEANQRGGGGSAHAARDAAPAGSTRPAKSQPVGRFASHGSSIFTVLIATMAVVLIISNIGASKGVTFGEIVTDGGFFLFPLAYIIGDVVSEIYGFSASRLAIITTFALSAFAAVCYWVIIALPGAEWYDGQEALERTLGPVPLIVIASLLGFLTGQLANSWTLVRLKRSTGERLLFGRIALSTVIGELVDTVVFCSIAAQVIGITDFGTFLNYVLVGFAIKTIVEICFSPITMLVIRTFKRLEPSYPKDV